MKEVYVLCKKEGTGRIVSVNFEELKAGDTVFVNGSPRIVGEDAHYSGDADYDGYLAYDEDGEGLFPEDLDKEED